jgi:ribosome-associated protein
MGDEPARSDSRLLRVSRSLSIPYAELGWRVSPPGGPGGQHANKTSSRVEVRFDVTTASSLGPRQRARLLERIGPVVRATASDARSQARNRQLALERLRARIADALRTDPPRLPTAPTRTATKRRLEDKRRHSESKRRRTEAVDLD